MVEYFRDGGFPMWLILIAALATVVLAALARKQERSRVLFGGAFAEVVLGMLGMALGMVAVSKGVAHFPDKAAATAQGLGELANNGSFGAAFATLLGIGAIVTRNRDQVA
jgi:hypothetical protein